MDNTANCQSCPPSSSACAGCSTIPNCSECPGTTCTICSLGYFLLPNKTCIPCATLIPNCLDCSIDGLTCYKCLNGYVFNANMCVTCRNLWANCASCNSSSCITCFTGYVFWQGQCQKCNNCDGCVSFTLNIYGSLVCSSCNTIQFNPVPVNNVCVCRSGKLQNGVCTTDLGCVSATINSGIVSCIFCNSAKNYQITPINGVCQCMPHYALNQFSICADLCGDGVVMINKYLYCDDGNLVSGDGCSSTCNV